MSIAVAIIIPYYQTQPGVLQRTLRSIFAQRTSLRSEIIVVDDGAPVPIDSELQHLPEQHTAAITILRQANRGPGPARNTALSAVSESVKWVAFLDSDDIWCDQHLARAVEALDKGYDFFFADGNLEGTGESLFETVGFDPILHRPIDQEQSLYEFQGDFLAQVLDRSPLVTSSVVFRRARLGTIRFPNSKGACEDLRYWLTVAQTHLRVAFSPHIGVTGGTAGVHVSHIDNWKANKALASCADLTNYHAWTLASIPLTAPQRAMVERRLAACRADFARTALAMLRGRSLPEPSICMNFLARHPAVAGDFARVLLHSLSERKSLRIML
jgi:succinoglycan biosynthesis protein ExoW